MGNKYQSSNESTAEMYKALQQYAPDALRALLPVTQEQALSQAQTDALVSPVYAQAELDLLKRFGPEANKIGSEIDRANQMAASETELALARGPGRGLVTEADTLQRMLDPEYYKSRELLGEGWKDLLGGMDPNALSGSERAEVERAASRTLGFTPSATNTTANAMTFGKELQNKQSRFGDILTKLSSTLPSMSSGISGFSVATKRNVTPNAGANVAAGVDRNTGGQGWNFMNNSLNQVAGIQRQRDSQRQSLAGIVGDWAGIGGKFIGGVGSAMGGGI